MLAGTEIDFGGPITLEFTSIKLKRKGKLFHSLMVGKKKTQELVGRGELRSKSYVYYADFNDEAKS